MSAVEGHPPLRLVIVPGVTVEKWTRAWSQRLPSVPLQVTLVDVDVAATLIGTEADAGLVRLPVDRDALHAIPLYTETTVVVIPREHLLAAADEVTVADLAEESMLLPGDDALGWTAFPGVSTVAVDTTDAAVELVAAGVGLLVVPQSLARAYHRRDLTYRVVTDAPTSTVALVWRREEPPELIEDLIGIVRGRTVNSTRGQAPPPAVQQPPTKAVRREGTRREGPRRDAPKPRTAPRRRGR